MQQITVSLGQRSYPIEIGPGLLREARRRLEALPVKRWAVIADENTAALYAGALDLPVYTFPAGEGSKRLAVYEDLCRRLLADGFTRQDGIAALGGGVTGDLAGFIAGTLLRGVALAQLPTSLLAQVDSSVGGKTGLDLPEGKNLIGCFYQPRLVLADTACLATLPRRQLSSGMAEVIKCGVIGDEAILHHLETAEEPDLPWLVARCCRYKAAVVSRDERDGGGRRVLNFGHTFGHAYEAAGGYDTRTHGEAVAARDDAHAALAGAARSGRRAAAGAADPPAAAVGPAHPAALGRGGGLSGPGQKARRRRHHHRRGGAGRPGPSADGTPGGPDGGRMMDVRLLPAPLRGAVTPPPSKSLLHRQLICLAQAGEFPCPPDPSDDVEATVRGLWALYHEKAPVIDCGASGSTLRFLLPLAMARGQVGTVFTGTERLLERPLPGDWGLAATAGGLRVTRALSGGQIPVDGTRTSQLLSGLLMALPGLAADSELALTGPLASRPYVDLTLAVLRRCGVHIGQTDCGFTIPGGQRFRTVPLDAEPDWSAAAFWLAVRALGCAVAVTGLRRDSLQGDRAAAALCRCLPEEVDLTDIPDLLPPLALLAALRPGTETRFTGAARLRDKESDRLASVSAALTALGGRVRQEPEGLTVWGVERLSGGEADSCGDHRIAMLCACAAPFCTGPVVLRNAGCTAKSYPGFWADYRRLGGQFEVL